MRSQTGKPRLTLPAAMLFEKIVRYAREHILELSRLPEAASDVMDGLCRNSDPAVKELKNKNIIQSVRFGGNEWTWELTEHGCEVVSRIPSAPDYVI